MFERSGVHIDPRMLAGRLTPAERALVSLVIALDRAPSELSLLILDEVTASLPRDEAAPYLEKIAALAQSGVSVLMVTHRLAEVRSKASRMTVLRNGKDAYVGSPAETDDDAIIAMMVGSSEVERAGAPPRTSVLGGFWSDFRVGAQATRGPDEPLMEVEGLAGEQLADVTFTLHVGEILASPVSRRPGSASSRSSLAERGHGGQAAFPSLAASLGRAPAQVRPWRPGSCCRKGTARMTAACTRSRLARTSCCRPSTAIGGGTNASGRWWAASPPISMCVRRGLKRSSGR